MKCCALLIASHPCTSEAFASMPLRSWQMAFYISSIVA